MKFTGEFTKALQLTKAGHSHEAMDLYSKVLILKTLHLRLPGTNAVMPFWN